MTAFSDHNSGERGAPTLGKVARLEGPSGRPWTDQERVRFQEARSFSAHLGEAAEAVGRTVIEVQLEFGIGPNPDVARQAHELWRKERDRRTAARRAR